MIRAINTRRLATISVILVLGACSLFIALKRPHPNNPIDQRLASTVTPDGLPQVNCLSKTEAKPLVILALGQSNAANHADIGTSSPPPRREFYQGKCFLTQGPSLGATGNYSSIWALLAPRLQEQANRPVIFSTVAIESTSIGDWAAPGRLQAKLIESLQQLADAGLGPDLIVWQQGEADAIAGTDSDSYFYGFHQLLKTIRAHTASPLVVALSTRCRNSGGEPIRDALLRTAATTPGVFIGPDTDGLAGEMRDQDCHFSAQGAEAASKLWESALLPRLKNHTEPLRQFKTRHSS